ncbi:MAG: hypothetical protein U0269_19775 [Polyangiales bacterium]
MCTSSLARRFSFTAIACTWLLSATAHAQTTESTAQDTHAIEGPDTPAPVALRVTDCHGDACYGRFEGQLKVELALVGLVSINANANAFDGAGGRMTTTLWFARWTPSRTFSLSFLSLGISATVASVGTTGTFDAFAGFETAVRARIGLERGVSFSGTLTWAPLLDTESYTADGGASHVRGRLSALSYRIEPLVHFGRHFAMGAQFADAYTNDLQLRQRTVGTTLLFAF